METEPPRTPTRRYKSRWDARQRGLRGRAEGVMGRGALRGRNKIYFNVFEYVYNSYIHISYFSASFSYW